MKVRVAQINPIVGNIDYNTSLIKDTILSSSGADLVVFPELSIVGYPPQDLLLDNNFILRAQSALDEIVGCVDNQVVIVGYPQRAENGNLYNSAAVIQNNRIVGGYAKNLLPTYDVFDETRYFMPSGQADPVTVEIDGKEVVLGIQICEDLWDKNYSIKVTDTLISKGAELIINISASPYRKNIFHNRLKLCADRSNDLKYYFIYSNIVGGQDELVFDGRSFIMDCNGRIKALASSFKDMNLDFDSDRDNDDVVSIESISDNEDIFNALVLGVKDYFRKSGFQRAVIGLSGGIDSALTAAIAAEAIGGENVTGISMPSIYSSKHSKEDAKALAANLGIDFHIIEISSINDSYLSDMGDFFIDTEPGLAEENLQARIRGNILMSVSNKIGALVLNTGNKTELALGYCTMYGDMCGALAVISDLNKLEVYALSKWINESTGKETIPQNTIRKRPSAELRENQYDPFDYSLVSPAVDHIVNDMYSFEDLIEAGYESDLVEDIYNRVNKSEYKRRQSAPGIKISQKAFGMGRRFPINNQFRDKR